MMGIGSEVFNCIACEDRPYAPNDPCAVCGKTSAVALPDELEVVERLRGCLKDFDDNLLACMASGMMEDRSAYGEDVSGVMYADLEDVVDRLSQAHSTIAALRADCEEYKDAGHNYYARALRAEAQVQRLTEDNEALRGVVSECASALPNGAFVHPTASLEFMAKLPGEVKSVSDRQEVRIKALEEALGNMRCPRPCNHRPDEFDAKDCVTAGECGCGAAILSGGLNAPS